MSVQKLKDYFDYENKVYYTKEELISVLNQLNITASIAYLLKQKVIYSVKRNSIYQVLKNKNSLPELLELLFKDNDNYYFSGLYAYNKYGFVEQLPQRIQITNTHFSGEKQFGGFNFIFYKRIRSFFYGIDEESKFPNLERALVDYCYDFGFEKFEALWDDMGDKVNQSKLIEYALNYPVNAVARKVLYLIGKTKKLPKKAKDKVVTSSLITLYSNPSRRGPIDREWNIIINR